MLKEILQIEAGLSTCDFHFASGRSRAEIFQKILVPDEKSFWNLFTEEAFLRNAM